MKIEYGDKVGVKTLGLSVWLDFQYRKDEDTLAFYSLSPKQARKLAHRLMKAAASVDGRASS